MRDATDYYNLFIDTLKYGRNQIQYIYGKIEQAIEKGKYVNIRTGYLIKEKDCNDYNYYFNNDVDYPLCYYFSCRGLARERVIKKILDFYVLCLREYDKTKDEEKMKQLIDNEIESAKKKYEELNKNNKGYDDLKLFNLPPHSNEPKETENSINSSSFINDNSSISNENNSFINDDEINEENGEKSEDIIKNKKVTLIKNGRNAVNKYKQELDELLEENYDGENDLINEENDIDLDLDTKGSSLKKKKLCKTKYLTRKTKRNIINDSDDEEEGENDEKEEEKLEKEDEQYTFKENNNLEKEIKNLIKKDEENEEESIIKNKKKKEAINKEYYKAQKEKLRLKQGNLDAFLNITH